MASIRLTETIRDTILKRLMDHAFAKREKDLVEERCKIAEKVYDAMFPKKVRDHMAKMPALYDKRDTLYFYVGGRHHHIDLRTPRIVPPNTERLSLASDDPLAVEFENHRRKGSALDEEIQTAYSVFTNGRDFVVATNADGARAFLQLLFGVGYVTETTDGWGPCPPEMPLLLNGETRSALEWLQRCGPGYLGSVES